MFTCSGKTLGRWSSIDNILSLRFILLKFRENKKLELGSKFLQKQNKKGLEIPRKIWIFMVSN